MGRDKNQEVSNIARNGQNIERQDSEVTGYSNFAVVRDKIPVKNDQRHI